MTGAIVFEDSLHVMVRHPGLKLKLPAWVFCVSWCPDFEFRGTYPGKAFANLLLGMERAFSSDGVSHCLSPVLPRAFCT